jgi:thioesterase domain-containing protein
MGFGGSTRFQRISYPSWRWYTDHDPSLAALVDELVRQIEITVPEGPIAILGFSIGGHFGYLTALKLQEARRQITAFCAVDALRVHSAAASPGWLGRAAKKCMGLISKRQFADLLIVFRSRFWRTLLRLCQGRLLTIARAVDAAGVLKILFHTDPLLVDELKMRLLIQTTAPGLAAIDSEPQALATPTILLRTATGNKSDEYWSRRCPTLYVCEVPGDHETMLEQQNWEAAVQLFHAMVRKLGMSLASS